MAETYLPDTDYDRPVGTLLNVAPVPNIEPCPFAGHMTEDGIKAALVERCDIWPERIKQ